MCGELGKAIITISNQKENKALISIFHFYALNSFNSHNFQVCPNSKKKKHKYVCFLDQYLTANFFQNTKA